MPSLHAKLAAEKQTLPHAEHTGWCAIPSLHACQTPPLSDLGSTRSPGTNSHASAAWRKAGAPCPASTTAKLHCCWIWGALDHHAPTPAPPPPEERRWTAVEEARTTATAWVLPWPLHSDKTDRCRSSCNSKSSVATTPRPPLAARLAAAVARTCSSTGGGAVGGTRVCPWCLPWGATWGPARRIDVGF
jgi:hypothetical protein